MSDVSDASDDAPAEAEPSVTLVDMDGDGAADVVAVDDTGDGRADFALVDETGDGLVDVVVVPGETLTIDNSGVLTEPAVDDGADPGTFDVGDIPVDADLPGLPGDVLEPEVDTGGRRGGAGRRRLPTPTTTPSPGTRWDADEWFLQAANGFCVPAALAMVITEMTGEQVTDLGVAAVAEELGLLHAEGGGEDGFSGMTSQGALETLRRWACPRTSSTHRTPTRSPPWPPTWRPAVTSSSPSTPRSCGTTPTTTPPTAPSTPTTSSS